jgi:phage FluMu protein Com
VQATPLIEIRCPSCDKLLLKAQGEKVTIEVKCIRCREIITLILEDNRVFFEV